MASFDAALGSSNTSSTTVTTSAAAASGSKVIVCVEWFHATATLSSVSGGSLTWTIDKQFLAGSVGVAIISADAPSGLASSTTITLTYSTTPTAGGISVFSFLGLQSGGVDTTNSFNGGLLGTPAAWNSGNLVTTGSDVLVAIEGYDKAAGVSNTPTSPAIEVHDLQNGTSGESLATEYRIEPAAGTYTVAGSAVGASGTGQLNAIGVAYKADSGLIGPPNPILRMFNQRGRLQALALRLLQPPPLAAPAAGTTWTGSSTVSLVVTVTTAGTRSTFGVSSVPIVVSVTTTGTRKTFGVSSVPIIVTVTTAGSRKTFGVSSVPIVVNVTTSGTRKTFGVSSVPIVVNVTTAGVRRVFAVSTVSLIDTITTAGLRKTFAISTVPIVVSVATSGKLSARSSSTVPIFVNVTTAGTGGAATGQTQADPNYFLIIHA